MWQGFQVVTDYMKKSPLLDINPSLPDQLNDFYASLVLIFLQEPFVEPFVIKVEPIKIVDSFKFLGTIIKRAQQCLYFLRQLKFDLDRYILTVLQGHCGEHLGVWRHLPAAQKLTGACSAHYRP